MDHPLLSQWNLVTFDLPGHGSAPRDPKLYTFQGLVHYLKHKILALHCAPPVLVGHSLGGHLAIALSRELQLSGLITLNTPPLETLADFEKAFIPSEKLATMFQASADEQQVRDLAASFAEKSATQEMITHDFIQTDPSFRPTFAASLNSELKLQEHSQLLTLSCPVEIHAFADDSTVSFPYFQSLTPLNALIHFHSSGKHYHHHESPDFLPLVLDRFLPSI